MGYIIAKRMDSNSMSAWVETKFYWPGTVTFIKREKCINLFLNEKTHNCNINYAKSLIEEFPRLFINVDFYTEEGINKVLMDISPEYNLELK